MQRRKKAAASASHERKLKCAQHLIDIAIKQNRMQLLFLAYQWKNEITRERHYGY